MSKRELKSYLKNLKKEHLEEQVLVLYERFPEVKTYYNFVFNPREDKLADECKLKISNEYFPVGRRKKAKTRRSVAQKYIKHFIQLGVQPDVIADVMLYNIEIAQAYAEQKFAMPDAFYKSMLKSFEQAIDYSFEHNLLLKNSERYKKIAQLAKENKWPNFWGFSDLLQRIQ